MAKSSTTLKKGDRLPSRGRDKRTLILEAIKAQGLLGVDKNDDKEAIEKKLFGHLAMEAVTSEDTSIRNTCLSALMDRGWSKVKPASEIYTFELDENADPTTQARQIMKAVSAGEIPHDVGSSLITALGTVMKIAELDEFERRLKALEKANDETETP